MFSDQQLRTYLAGDAAEDEAARIEAMLGADPDLERRLMALDAVAEPVRAAFSTLPDATRLRQLEAGIAGAIAPAHQPAHRTPWRRAAAGVLLGVALGTGGALFATDGADAPRDWRGMVAVYQALYTEDTIAPIAVDRLALEAQFAQAEAAIGAPLPRESLAVLGDLTLLRAQVLGLEGRPIVQIVYRDPAGAPIALCVTRAEGGDDAASPAPSMMREGLASAAWAEAGLGFILIGGQDLQRIDALAATVRDRWS